MKKLFILLFLCIFFGACKSDSGELLFIEQNTENGFQFPYFLYIPEGASQTDSLILIIEPNNSGFADDDFDKHIEKAKRTASKDFYLGNYVARSLKYPLLVPVFPRSESNWKIYTHALDRDVMVQKNNDLERIDLQLLAMVEDAKKRLSLKSYSILNQFFITGFSASGTFANRFTLLHPEKVLATAAGGLNGLLMLPIKSLDSLPLNYPVGVNDYQSLFGNEFGPAAFKSTPQYYFFGELDDNDAIPYDDGYDNDERTLIYKLLGEDMHAKRWVNCTKIYKQEQVNAKIVSYPGIGHEQTDKTKEDVLDFFISCNK